MNCSNSFSQKNGNKYHALLVNIRHPSTFVRPRRAEVRGHGGDGEIQFNRRRHLIKITFYSILFKLLTAIHFSFALLPEVHGKQATKLHHQMANEFQCSDVVILLIFFSG